MSTTEASVASDLSTDQVASDDKLNELLSRIQELKSESIETPSSQPELPEIETPSLVESSQTLVSQPEQEPFGGAWYPTEPADLREAGLTESDIQNLAMKALHFTPEMSGRGISEQIRVPFRLVEPLLQALKLEQLIAHKGAAMMNDYVFHLTDKGRERSRKLIDQSTYSGAAPVTLQSYVDSVAIQTLNNQHPVEDDLHRAFEDLLIDKQMLLRLGPAINSGKGMFLYGAPGNGKTSIAERVTKAFGEYIWVPRAIGFEGEVMRLFDPGMHEEAPIAANEGLIDNRAIDQRWVRIKRPTIVVGGELTMDQLEISVNRQTNVMEAPVQLKSNCGTLVIDDFGRQRMTTDELLNRWIVPLEKRYDFLSLASGKKIQVPFDQLVVFSTNLEPKDLVDDAFLRRIPYKIEVADPEESAFRKLMEIMGKIVKVDYDQDAIDYLVETHYKAVNRPFRCCQPRDLLLQVRNFCLYVDKQPVMSRENFDFAMNNYFAVME